MKSILISIKPKWCEKICHEIGKDGNGKPIYEKRIEVRKTAPKEVPFKVYIYCTKTKNKWSLCDYEGAYQNSKGEIVYAQQHIIGEFICDKVDEYKFHEGLTEFNSMGLPSRIYGSYLIFADDYKAMCLSYDEVKNYGKHKTLYGWHIYDLKIYDKPKELREFKTGCNGCKERDTYHCKFHCYGERPLTRPPQSYMFVEEV